MALSGRERECIEALCACLGSHRGGRWDIVDDSLDAMHPNEPTPEAIVSNGDVSAAVEVKSLLWPKGQARFWKSVLSLRRSLVPSVPGHYVLVPPNGWEPPWSRSFIRRLRAGIEEACQVLAADEEGYVRVSRRSLLVGQASGGGLVWCSHGRGLFSEMSVRGTYYLVDSGGSHSFKSEEGKREFLSRVLVGMQRIESGEKDVWLEWEEEWPLLRYESDKPTIEVLALAGASELNAAAFNTAQPTIAAANRKFHRRWADRHAVVLDRQFIFADEPHVKAAFGEIAAKDYENIDDVYLFEEGVIKPIFSRSQGSS